MELITPSVEIWEQGTSSPVEDMYAHIARCTRVCYQSEKKGDESEENFVKRVILRHEPWNSEANHCYTGDCEILTIKGWIKFSEYNGEAVATVKQTGLFNGYETPKTIQNHIYTGKFYEYPELGIKVTDGHRMFGAFRQNNKSFATSNNYQMFVCNDKFIHNNVTYTYGERQFKTRNCCVFNPYITDAYYELLGFWIGDGTHNNFKNKITFHLNRPDKISYLYKLAKAINAAVDYSNDYFRIVKENIGEKFNKYYKDGNKYIEGKEYSQKQIASIILGLLNADSNIRSIHKSNTNTIVLGTTSEAVCKWIMEVAPIVGYTTTFTKTTLNNDNWKDIYKIYFHTKNYTIHNDSRKPNSKVVITEESLPVYCVSVSTGIIIVRGSKGISTVCGNCAMLEHGTVYLNIYCYNGCEDSNYYKIVNYRNNKYSKVNNIFNGGHIAKEFAITTNLRVLVENNWLDDLKYICKPTEHHFRRVTVSFITNIGVSREFNRHRVNSIAEESTRYCNYNKRNDGQIKIGLPAWLLGEEHLPYIESHQFDSLVSYCDDICTEDDKNWSNIDYYLFALTTAEYCYNMLIKKGWTPQKAREVLPLATKTQLIHTAFVNDWKHFIALRADGISGPPHPNAKLLAAPLKELFIKQGIL